MSKVTNIEQARRAAKAPAAVQPPSWTKVRHELNGAPNMRGADASAPIHAAWCTCRSCLQRDALAYARRRRTLQIWAVLFIALGAALYGLVFASLPQIAAAFGWRF